MDQAKLNDNTPVAGQRSAGVDRRLALRLIAASAASGATLPAASSPKAETPDQTAVEVYFKIWENSRANIKKLDRIVDTTLRDYELRAPEWPDRLRYLGEGGIGWQFYGHRADLIFRDSSGVMGQFFGVEALNEVVARLRRICPADAPIMIEALECLALAERLESQENEAGKVSGFDQAQRDFDVAVELAAELAAIILALEPTCAVDLRIQAEVLRDRNSGIIKKDEAMIRFLNSVMSSRFDI